MNALLTEAIGENEIATKVNEFRERLLNSLPVNLMTAEFKNYVFYNSNERLEEAKRAGANLADITIGDDCLPTWPGRIWDPSEESLHDFIQAQLASHHEAQQAGKLVCEDIIWKGNRKLDEAKALGLELENIQIGLNLLPV